MGVISGRYAACTCSRLPVALLARTCALLAGGIVRILVVSIRTNAHTGAREWIVVESGCAGGFGTVIAVIPSYAVTNTPHAISVLGAPVGTGLSGPDAKLVVIRTGEVPSEGRNGLLGGCVFSA